MNGDIMEMNRVQTIPLGPFAEINFAPGKYHIMLVNVQKNLNIGDEIEITLHFKNFEDINLNVPVQEITSARRPFSIKSLVGNFWMGEFVNSAKEFE